MKMLTVILVFLSCASPSGNDDIPVVELAQSHIELSVRPNGIYVKNMHPEEVYYILCLQKELEQKKVYVGKKLEQVIKGKATTVLPRFGYSFGDTLVFTWWNKHYSTSEKSFRHQFEL